MRPIVAIIIMAFTITVAFGKELVVVGGDDGLPIAGATLLSKSGHIVGITDKNGIVEQPNDAAYPLTSRSLGYEVLTIIEPCDTIVLNTMEYALPEVSVTASARQFRRVVWYARGIP